MGKLVTTEVLHEKQVTRDFSLSVLSIHSKKINIHHSINVHP